MMHALQKHVGDVIVIHPKGMIALFLKLVELLLKVFATTLYKTTGKRFNVSMSVVLSMLYGFVYGALVKKSGVDVIFCAIASSRIAFLRTKLPVIFLSDTTFKLMIDYSTPFTNLIDISKRSGNIIVSRTLKKAKVIIYSSSWAANSAMNDYGVDKNKIHVIPFGANIDQEDIPTLAAILNKHKSDKCRLLFIGKDWIRKGGNIAYETLLELKKIGIPSRLTVVGCVPPADKYDDPDLVVIPYLDKRDPEQRKRFYKLYMDADFFIFPTRAECSPIVSCESCAFGLPILATDTGGVKFYVKDGINGYCLPYSARGREYARTIRNIFTNKDQYQSIVIGAYNEYTNRLNWDIWGISVNNVFTLMGIL